MKTLAKAATVGGCVWATCYLAMNCHRITAVGTFVLALVALVLLPDDDTKSTP